MTALVVPEDEIRYVTDFTEEESCVLSTHQMTSTQHKNTA
jgi:hypothetical protein